MSYRNLEKNGLSAISVEALSEAALLKRKAVSGFFFLGARRIIFQLILTGSNIILARLLFPKEFGAFAIALGIISLLSIFASPGLVEALLQKKEEPNKDELQVTFTVNLLLSILTAAVIYYLAPLFSLFYQEQLGFLGVYYLRLLSLSMVIAACKGISLLLLERKLDYRRLVFGETLEILTMQVVTIVLAAFGFGVLSFIWGLLIGRFLAFVIFFILAPWAIGFKISFGAIRKLLPFAVNIQINTIVGGLNGAVVPIFVGKVSGASAVGLLNWAGGLAVFPRAIAEILGRLTFPVGARTQDNKQVLRQIIEKAIQLSCLSSFPLITGLVALAYPITYIIYTDKWLAGIPALYFFSLQSIFIVIGAILMQALLALGLAKAVRNISLFWAILQWLLTVPLVFRFGFTGLAAAGALVSSTFFIPMIVLRQYLEFKIANHVWPYLVYSLISGVAAYLLNYLYPIQGILDLLIIIGICGAIYFCLIFLFKRKEVIADVVRVRKILIN